MLTIFWDVSGPILAHFQEKCQAVICARYSDMLVNKLKLAIPSKRQELLSERILLLYDNARPHTAAHIVDTLHTLKFKVLKHPPYSADLAPSDFHLFGPMKFTGPEVCRRRGNGGSAKLVKGPTKSLFFSTGHPQACGQVDQVFCEVGDSRKRRH
jgi:hypothetical protein